MRPYVLATSISCAAAAAALAVPPAWWTAPDTQIVAPGGGASDRAVATVGQLKHVASQARAYLDLHLPGGAGAAVAAVVDGFTPGGSPENLKVANLGQLKAVAKPFYDRLAGAGYDTRANLVDRGYPAGWEYRYPWDPSTPAGGNYAPATLGQLKMVFSFDVRNFETFVDSNGDGLPDFVTRELGLDPLDDDLDGDGVSNADELAGGTDILLADTDGDGVDDAADAYPRDPSRWDPPTGGSGILDFTLTEPAGAVELP